MRGLLCYPVHFSRAPFPRNDRVAVFSRGPVASALGLAASYRGVIEKGGQGQDVCMFQIVH